MSGCIKVRPGIDLSLSVLGGQDEDGDYIGDDVVDDEPEVELIVGVGDADSLLQVPALKPDHQGDKDDANLINDHVDHF